MRIVQSDGSTVRARAADISGSGIGVKCAYAADAGKEFDLQFLLPVEGVPKPVRVRARVVFCNLAASENLFRIGLRFQRFYADSEQIIRRYISQRTASGGGSYITV